jgi:exodeoxyribonuclease-3
MRRDTARSGTDRRVGTGWAILARGAEPVETRRGLPGDPDDLHSRYIEAAISGLVVGCLYLPNGNPAPGPKFDYKLSWFERLTNYAQTLLDSGAPVILAGDFNVMPTELDVYTPERWVDDALFRPEVRDAYRRLVEQGWTDALRVLHPGERIYTFWKYFRNAFARDAGLRIDHLLLSPAVAGRLVAAGVDRDVRARERSSDHAPVWIELTDADAVAGRRRPVVSASSVIGCRSAGGAGTGSNREKPLLMGYASAAVLPRTGRACARLAGLTHQSEMTEMLERVAEDFEDMPCDLETGAVDVRHPELLPQLRRDGKR